MSAITLLPPRLSSRIAAGEVIDRPQAILRELLDNAIDAKGDEIAVTVDGGGIDRIKVKDNGSGIARDDVSVIASPHATSKIKTEDDLYKIQTLGFRGEALYSIGAVATLTVSTCDGETGTKSTITIDNGKRGSVLSSGPEKGTEVTSENLFYDIPARRSFLKRSSTEGGMCRSLFISKALAFPLIGFTLTMDGALRLRWPKGQTLKERVMMLYREYSIADADVYYLEKQEEEYRVRIVAASSAQKRSDRKEIRIYVNGRPVEEYSIVQAVIYGYGELLPGGSFPYACVFIDDKPELVDFNIHPAKKEVKLRNLPEVHHTVSSMLKEGIERKIPEIRSDNQFYLFDNAGRWENGKRTSSFGSVAASSFPSPASSRSSAEQQESTEKEENTLVQKYAERAGKKQDGETVGERITPYVPRDKDWLEKAKELRRVRESEARIREEREEAEDNKKDEIIYIGQAFRLFLICERNGVLYLVDQHAAHERILYDEIVSQKTLQNLLVPIKLEVDDITDEYLENHCHIYTKLGIMLGRISKGNWEITAIPAVCRGIEDKITSFVVNAKSDEHELEENLFATMACRAAIKMGDEVDRYTALGILEKVFRMDEPCCPHGRTFLIRLTKENLMKMVGRTV